MRHLIMLFFCCTFLFASAQTGKIDLGILPTEYAEGMPPIEFLSIEEQIIEEFKKVPMYNVVKMPEDYYEVKETSDLFSEFEAIRQHGKASNVPYLLQIIFGDTEWRYEQVDKVIKAAVKDEDGNETQPAETKRYRNYHSTIWVTLNLYDVETGKLAESQTFNSVTSGTPSYSTSKNSPQEGNYRMAVKNAKNTLMYRLRKGIRTLQHLDADIIETIEKDDKGIKTVKIRAGSFKGVQYSDRLYMYYEHEHIINGQSVIREVHVGNLVVSAATEKYAICSVNKKGRKKLQELLGEGKKIKCNFAKPYTHGF